MGDSLNKMITFDDFTKVDLRIGTIIEVNDFPNARKPAYQLTIDFGDLGVKKSSAQITTQYQKEDLVNRQIVAVINFPKKQIANFMSECLVMGAVREDDVFLLHPETKVKNGSQVS
ncbi:tRNA-binding protein [Winogradskyella ouciana]|uniref:tRNA-binding protein n=1 Tax=Winogradskyella ouciana TaxID=2608631 RepID=A0A7K1GH51_9FLAO|nr:tRNA-binding protein [Winogradskyella ouciana]MTE27758.1 tRNA-binding protein [Winogradskyella ouciana]